MKKYISVTLLCACVISLMSGYAYSGSFPSNGSLLPEDKEQEIFSRFASEIDYAKEMYDLNINALDEEAFRSLKRIAVLNLDNADYDFSGLIDAVAIACEEKCIINTYDACAAARSTTTSVYREFGAVRGKHILDVPTGASQSTSGTVKIEVASGETLYGVKLSESVSASVTYTINGPADGATLRNGREASHRTAFGVLYGTIMKQVYESPRTGEIIETYYVNQSSAYAVDYTTLTLIGMPTYADKVTKDKTCSFKNPQEMRDIIKNTPGELI